MPYPDHVLCFNDFSYNRGISAHHSPSETLSHKPTYRFANTIKTPSQDDLESSAPLTARAALGPLLPASSKVEVNRTLPPTSTAKMPWWSLSCQPVTGDKAAGWWLWKAGTAQQISVTEKPCGMNWRALAHPSAELLRDAEPQPRPGKVHRLQSLRLH